jgi:hypothetical protein
VVPAAICAPRGVIAMELSVTPGGGAGWMVAVTAFVIAPYWAVIVAVATLEVAEAVAKPFAAILSKAVLLEDHVTLFVRSCVELSEKVPVAVNCWEAALSILALAGVIAREDSDAALTVSGRVALRLPTLPVMVTEPTATPVTTPVLLTDATLGLDELQVAEDVTFSLTPEAVSVTLSCAVVPTESELRAADTAIELVR